jgi:hypothetical protein
MIFRFLSASIARLAVILLGPEGFMMRRSVNTNGFPGRVESRSAVTDATGLGR